MIRFTHKGDFHNTENLLTKIISQDPYTDAKLKQYGEMGLAALREFTPKDTGKTANSWSYEITKTSDTITITWSNSNVEKGYANVAVLLQYGHATRNGGYVHGIDYINPAMKPVFDSIAENAWKEVTIGR